MTSWATFSAAWQQAPLPSWPPTHLMSPKSASRCAADQDKTETRMQPCVCRQDVLHVPLKGHDQHAHGWQGGAVTPRGRCRWSSGWRHALHTASTAAVKCPMRGTCSAGALCAPACRLCHTFLQALQPPSSIPNHHLDIWTHLQVAGLQRSAAYGARVELGSVTSLPACLAGIYRREGLAGLYKGSVPSLIKAAPAAAITFTVYETVLGLMAAAQTQSA